MIVITRSNPIAPDPRVEKCAHALLKAGYAVQIVGWDRSASHPPREVKDGLTIERFAIPSRFGSGTRNMLPFLRWQIQLGQWLGQHRREIDAIHACDFDTVLPAFLAKKLWGIPVVYDIFDFYADHVRSNARLRNLIRIIDHYIIARVDAVILVDEVRRVQLENCPVKRCEIVYNSPPDRLPELQSASLRRPAGAPFQIGYVGLLQKDRGLLELIAVLKRHPEWQLELAGFGGDESLILAAAAGLPNIRWHGKVDYTTALELSFQSDVILATYNPAIRNNQLASANKIFEAMMLAKAVIVAHDTNMDRMAQEAQAGVVVTYGDVAELEQALQSLADQPDLRAALGAGGRKAYEEQYAGVKMEARIVGLYREIL